MSELGSYITNEYGILKQILSYLPSRDLLNASDVCREWREVAKRIIIQNNRPVGCTRNILTGWSSFQANLQPKLVLHFSTSYGRKRISSDLIPTLSETYDLKDASVFNIKNDYFIASEYIDGKLVIHPKLGKEFESALFLCDMPGVIVNSFYFNGPLSRQDRESLDKLSDAKCLILIASGDIPCISLAQTVTSIFNKGESLLMAGGLANRAVSSLPYIPYLETNYALLGITFHGENLTPHLGLHQLSKNLQQFMESFAREVGPLPKGSIRIAFMFSCINRLRFMKDKEASIFSKYFPNVPVYGFWSYGEFAVNNINTSEPSPCKKAKLADWLYEESTSYLILTFNKD